MKRIKLSVVLLASLFLGACSSDDDKKDAPFTAETVSVAPVWQMDWSNNQARPNWTWTDEDCRPYQNSTILKVQLEDALAAYVSKDDLMAIFINDELRGLVGPAVNVNTDESSNRFLLKVFGNETGSETVKMAVTYYCAQLKHIFTLSEEIKMDDDETTGIDEDFILPFTLGSAKYPVVKTGEVEPILTAIGITPETGTVGAFIGNECRGTVTLSASGKTSLVVFGRNAGETVTLKYYNPAKSVVYTIPNAVTL